MKKIEAHITVDGRPLCHCRSMHGEQCGQPSIASAKRAALGLRYFYPRPETVLVVRGPCPYDNKLDE